MDSNQQLIARIQATLREFNIPAWLFYGFHDRDPIELLIFLAIDHKTQIT